MKPNYEDFRITVEGQDGRYTVEATGPGGINIDPLPFALDRDDGFLGDLEHIRWGIEPAGRSLHELLVEVGTRLFEALFPRKIIRAFERACEGATSLRLKLKIVPPELNHLPWEILYDPGDEIFLAVRLSAPIVRFLESGSRVQEQKLGRPPRILYVQANPQTTRPLQTGRSEEAIRAAYGDIDAVYNTSPGALLDMLLDDYDIIHYDGHATFDRDRRAGVLYLHDEQGQRHELSSRVLASLLDRSPTRLIVLAACETAAVDNEEKTFSGLAQQLMHTVPGLPAVVAMQFAIPDASAIAFTRGFYRALAAGYPVDAAVVRGRQSILLSLKDQEFSSPDWFTPVLFMHTENGDIFQEEQKMAGQEDKEQREEKRGDTVDTGGGAYIGGGVNTGGGDFTGRDRITHGDEVHGDKFTGDKVGGDKVAGDKISGDINVEGGVHGRGAAIGHKATANYREGVSGDELARLFAPLIAAAREAPPERRAEAVEKVETLKEEVAKGEEADDSRMATLVDGLVGLAPGAASAVVSIFATPVVAGLAGPVTRFVLDKLRPQ